MPWIPLITTGISLASSAMAAKKRKDAESAIENTQTPTYSPNQSILNYYQTALNKYNTNPTDTMEYKATKQQIGQGVVQGLNSLQDRRSGLAGIPTLMANQNNSLLKAAVAGEQRKAQEFNVLGHAIGMKAGEDKAAFQQNQIAPFEKNYNLLAMKAAGQAQVQNANIQNAYNNASSAAGMISGGQDNNSWGTGRNIWGQQTRNVGGYNWTKPKYNKANSAWQAGYSGGIH